ncbi:DEAD/DEAH box helicase [Photobacterium carnosum]|uniref:DEAD/DEAH box helicase n=1 Tax=Photobacterium carnosum TaxID=2023717 RepID=UPI001C91A9CA|nr:DEAD/DEAH box helicase family protein [Photobacterium carnosum]
MIAKLEGSFILNISGFIINDVLWDELRTCQQDSIRTALSYIRKPLNNEARSCLISLPTGAGKSGVISVISHKATQKKTLVLCHRRAVCNQLLADIKGKFFSERAEGDLIHLKSAFDTIDDTSNDGIYVSTFQKLQTFTKEQLDILKQNIELVIIDEGHAEPSPVWRNLVRGINAHKIVITATPYRNDLFQFDIDANASYIYTFEKALNDGVLKLPMFEIIQPDNIGLSIRQFLDNNDNTKCIIKCNKFSDVEYYYNLLNDDFHLLAIHEQYTGDSRGNTKSSVPANLKGSDYEVIIHQRKLDEGVDIPQAKLLVLTYAVSSGRELVQTIGRIVRLFNNVNPKVLELGQNTNEKMWHNYRTFDSSLNDDSAVTKFIASLDVNRLIERYLESFPDVSYYGNRFLSKFDLNNFNPEKSLNIPTASVCFLNKSIEFNSELMLDTLYWRCNNSGELARKIDTQYDIKVIISIAFNKSKFLTDQFFFEPALEITLFKEVSPNIVAIYDSRGRRFNGDKDLNLGSAITQDQLLNVMSLGVSAKTKEASSRSISTAKRRPESVAVKGPDLEQVADLQFNSSYRLSTMRCDTYNQYEKKSGSYYVGVDSGRISDQKESSFSLNELNDWLSEIGSMILSNSTISNTLVHSFAKPIPVNINLTINSLIFDFSNISNPINILIGDESYVIENDFIYREYNNGFLLIPDVEETRVTVRLSEEEPYLNLIMEEEVLYSLDSEDIPHIDIIELLNEYLHKALLENGVGYSKGKFFELKLPVENEFDIANSQLANVIIGLDALLGSQLDEKGYHNNVYQVIGQDFSPNSIFYLLDKIKGNALPNPTRSDLGPFYQYIPGADLVLNTDMGTEPADFIISSPNKLVYVHVKCGSSRSPQSSAGALAEVGSQAIKNIEMLISNNRNLKVANWTRLLGPWPQTGAAQQMKERIRMFEGQAFTAVDDDEREAKINEVWDVITKRRCSSQVDKEVWIVAANSFSASDFATKLSRGHNARGESLQAYQLIQSWLSTAKGNDVSLKIFVSP